jgi:hypothetical protein
MRMPIGACTYEWRRRLLELRREIKPLNAAATAAASHPCPDDPQVVLEYGEAGFKVSQQRLGLLQLEAEPFPAGDDVALPRDRNAPLPHMAFSHGQAILGH